MKRVLQAVGLILMAAVLGAPTADPDQPFDIKPGSCPNSLNVKSNGVLPVAVLGTADFHVTQIDPATVMLEGVAPLTWSVEDVGTPWEEFPAVPQSHDDCNDLESDGFLDLTVKYKTQEVVGALGCDTLNDGDVLTLFLQGALREEYGALLFDGFDVVVIRKKGLDC